MEIKAIFIDIDGTLLNSQLAIAEETKACLLTFQKAGGKVILSSARPYVGMKKYGDELELAKYGGYYSAFNGGQIVHAATLESINVSSFTKLDVTVIAEEIARLEAQIQEKAIKESPVKLQNEELTIEAARSIHSIINKTILNIMTYNGAQLIAKYQEIYALIEMFVNGMSIKIEENFGETFDFEPVKFLISGDPTLIAEVYPLLHESLGESYDVVTSDPFFLEITPQNVNKGNSLRTLAKALDIPVSETAAFGDSHNDISMLEVAGVGIAMANASTEIKEMADYTTKSNDENGIAEFLNRHCSFFEN